MSSGHRGEVYEVNGDQVAVILDSIENKTGEEGKDELSLGGDATRPSIYWINSKRLLLILIILCSLFFFVNLFSFAALKIKWKTISEMESKVID